MISKNIVSVDILIFSHINDFSKWSQNNLICHEMLIFCLWSKTDFYQKNSKKITFFLNIYIFGDMHKNAQSDLKKISFSSICWYLRRCGTFRIRRAFKNFDVLWWGMKVRRLRNTGLKVESWKHLLFYPYLIITLFKFFLYRFRVIFDN